MPLHLRREIDQLKKRLLALSAQVEESFQKAVGALNGRDAVLAREVIDADERIDAAEVEVEEECLKILALHQPVAIDLRFIIAVLKINNDLERIGDLATNIAERAIFLADNPEIDMPFDVQGIANKTQRMVKNSLDALINLDADLARQVCASDDEVDAVNADNYARVQDRIRRNPDQLDCLVPFLSVSRYLERIADHATNISEDVIYMIEGDIIRHKDPARGVSGSGKSG